MSKNSQILEAVGGLEAAQVIIERAPDGATDVVHINPLQGIGYSYPETIEYSKDVDGERWHWNQVHGWFKSQMPLEQAARLTGRHTHIPLSELRTAIIEQREFESRLEIDTAPVSHAVNLAEKWHAGQKYGDHNYFSHHILGVATRLTKKDFNHHAMREIIITAYLHDILEDTACPESEVANFGNDVLVAVKAITKQKDESNSDYLHRCKSNEIARIVKIADARFNRDQNWNDPVRFAYYDAVVDFMNGRTDKAPEKAAGHRIDTDTSEQRVTELNQSVEQAKAALNTFSYEPKKAVSTHAELVLHEQIKNLNSSRNFWRVMFFAVFIFYGLAWWIV